MELPPVTKKLVAFGSKQVFLPKFTIALIRTPTLSPYHAQFKVPLNFSKYDLRDYLYHAYNVKVHSIRSLVKQYPVRDTQKQSRHWFRPESEKFMTVEMEKPFVWPENPESWEPWGRKERQDSIAQSLKFQGVVTKRDDRLNAKEMRLHALRVLMGQDKAAAKTKQGKLKAGRASVGKVAKPKPVPEELIKKWEAERTPQILGQELLGSENYAGVASTTR